MSSSSDETRLLTVGHGTATKHAFGDLLRGAGVELVVDVRTAPGSRRHPHFARDALAYWLPEAGIAYRWEPRLGGWRKPVPDSPNTALTTFRGYADYMRTPEFRDALDALLRDASATTTAAMCAESVWSRCHRRMIADAAATLRSAEVLHLFHDGRLQPHAPHEAARRESGQLVYDSGMNRLSFPEA